MRCKNCGAENDDSRYICEVCGSPLYDENELSAQADQQPVGATPDGAPAPAPRPNPEEEKKLQQKNKQSMIIIIVLCVVLIAVVVGIIIAVASGNDACVAMAEYLAGSESTFVEKMNARAAELGMENTVFVNCTGLPAEGHHSSAYDIALMSRALIQNHPDIRTYTTIWMDTLRDGTFQLANTNKLIRFYEGATGLKTGSTDAALYCVSATAEKDGMELIAVVLGSPTSADRFETAKALLNYGFAGYSLVTVAPSEPISPIPVTLGTADSVQPVLTQESQILLPKAEAGKVSTTLSLPDTLQAPVEKGQELGSLTVLVDGKENQKLPLVAQEEVPRLTLWAVYQSLLGTLFCGT